MPCLVRVWNRELYCDSIVVKLGLGIHHELVTHSLEWSQPFALSGVGHLVPTLGPTCRIGIEFQSTPKCKQTPTAPIKLFQNM